MLTLLYNRVREASFSYSLKKFRNTTAGTVDLLNYAAVVDDGIIVGKNGCFMAAWVYEGRDNSTLNKQELEQISIRIAQAFSGMGNGWMVHIDAVRRIAPHYPNSHESYFPDLFSKAIDEERRKLFEKLGTLYEGYYVITLTWLPPLIVQNKFVELMFDDEVPKKSDKAQTIHLLKKFSNYAEDFERRLSSVFNMVRLKSYGLEGESYDNFLRWIQFCVTGINQLVRLPNNPIYLDSVIGGQDFYTGTCPKIGNKFIQCVSIDGFPHLGEPGILSVLSELPLEYRWSTRFIFMDHQEAIGQLKKFRRKWSQKIRGFITQIFNTNSTSVNGDAVDMVIDINSAIQDIESGEVREGYYTSTIILMNENRQLVEENAKFIRQVIEDLGFNVRIETVNSEEAFIGSFPGHGYENLRRPLMHSLNLADLMPTSSVWTGENFAPCPTLPPQSPALMHCITNSKTPFRLNLHVRDLGHTLIVGPTRSGKSTLLSMLALQWRRYKGARIFAFDKGLSMYPTCMAVNGSHYIIGDTSQLSFAPLQFLDTTEDKAWALNWIDTVLKLNGLETSANQRNEIALALDTMQHSDTKSVSEFSVLIQDEEIRETLKQYTIDGLMGDLVDARQDDLALSNFMTFEIERLIKLGEKYCLPILLYLFRRIYKSLDGTPTIIFLDEVWVMLQNPIFKAAIDEWLVSFAKLNCSIVLSTQHILQLAESGILDVVIESTASKIFLPNLNATQSDTARLYYKMGLSESQLSIIANSQPKKDYYYFSEKGGRLFNLSLSDLELSIAGSTDKESIHTISDLVKVHGDQWLSKWLKLKGLSQFSQFEFEREVA